MISYAQNFEDVMLARCFAGRTNGFYVDVGAAHPITDSVTNHFYIHGWRGINIEPVTTYFNLLVQERPEDINLKIAIDDKEGEADFFELTGTGLSTLIANEAERAMDLGFKQHMCRIKTQPLSAIFLEANIKNIDFLKVDVEGAEAAVLRSNDWSQFRPKIVLVEATRPNEPTPAWDEWEPHLLAQNYVFVWFDGLNRFYVTKEHETEFKQHFIIPPNVFDSFQRYSEIEARRNTDVWQQNYIDLLTRHAFALGIKHDRKMLSQFWPSGSNRKATSDDVHHAYRFILGREGDPAGIVHWLELTSKGKLAVGDIIKNFTDSPEYLQKREQLLKHAS